MPRSLSHPVRRRKRHQQFACSFNSGQSCLAVSILVFLLGRVARSRSEWRDGAGIHTHA